MRHLSVLTACLIAIATAAQASEPAHSSGHEAAKASAEAASSAGAKASAIPSIKPNIAPPKESGGGVSANVPGNSEEGETELQARIAKRIAEMREQQKARAAAAARAKKLADARRREAERIAALPPPPPRGTHWTYEGVDGPANWSKINVDWAACSAGNRQSPIDIRDGIKVDLEAISFDYKPTNFNVIDNGHTVQVNVGGGNYITVGNRTYELVQFHFHRPSEERVNGKSYEMVVHMVHKDPEGKLAVLAVLLERGRAMQAMQTVWNNLPLEKNDTVTPNVVLDLNEILPPKREYYTYMGSLTTPPCTEGVLWLVLKTPMQASPAQMAIFARLYPLNARPIQQAAGRVIKESN